MIINEDRSTSLPMRLRKTAKVPNNLSAAVSFDFPIRIFLFFIKVLLYPHINEREREREKTTTTIQTLITQES
jgi:hypothetical protein